MSGQVVGESGVNWDKGELGQRDYLENNWPIWLIVDYLRAFLASAQHYDNNFYFRQGFFVIRECTRKIVFFNVFVIQILNKLATGLLLSTYIWNTQPFACLMLMFENAVMLVF